MTTRCLGTRLTSSRAGRRAVGLAALVACSALFHARVACADGAAPASTSGNENVVVLPPLSVPADAAAASATGVPAASPELVVPLDETRRARAKRLRVRPYDGGNVPAGMHVEDRYRSTQKLPIYVGIPLFAGSYGMAALFAVSGRKDRGVNGKLLIPVVGALMGAVDMFEDVGTNTGILSGVADFIYAFAGFLAVVDGCAQATGLILTGVGISEMSKGPQPHLVADEAAVQRRPSEALRVAVRPFGSVGAARAAGVGVTITGF